jgi:hypothetical protein
MFQVKKSFFIKLKIGVLKKSIGFKSKRQLTNPSKHDDAHGCKNAEEIKE